MATHAVHLGACRCAAACRISGPPKPLLHLLPGTPRASPSLLLRTCLRGTPPARYPAGPAVGMGGSTHGGVGAFVNLRWATHKHRAEGKLGSSCAHAERANASAAASNAAQLQHATQLLGGWAWGAHTLTTGPLSAPAQRAAQAPAPAPPPGCPPACAQRRAQAAEQQQVQRLLSQHTVQQVWESKLSCWSCILS